MKHYLIKTIGTVLIIAVIFGVTNGCNKSSGGNSKPDFDRKAMLQNFADNLVKPAYNDLQIKINTLKSATEAFIAQTDATRLGALQTAWDTAYSSWMYANAYNIGPAGEEGIRKGLVEEIGTWPVNTTTVENNIAASKNDLNDFNRDNRGLNAVDYLIFDISGNHTNIVNAFKTNANRKNYLSAVVNKIKAQVDAVVTEWNGNYTATFVQKDGTDVGSSTSVFYNEFVRSFESIKNFKLGVPLGKRAGQTESEPTRVEARYSRKTISYLKQHIQAIDDIWHGKSKAGIDGTGWKEYLAFVTGGNELITRTEAQIAAIKKAVNAIPDTPAIEEQIRSNNAALEILHTELQKHVRNYKSDMSSLLGIAITFSSGDGD